MKKLALFSFLLFAQLAFSQDFISENKLWHVKDFSWDNINTQIFKIEGDTVINSNSYKKLWSSWDSTMSDLYPEGFLREESNVVYIYKPGSGEYILYDFNLEAGDTALVYNDFCGEVQVIVTGTDTVEYFGVPRKRWILDGWTEDYWIEGIGSYIGLVYTMLYDCVWDVYKVLTCYHENDTLYYMADGEMECFQTDVGIKEEADESRVIINPNPVIQGQSFVIQCNKQIIEVEVYNSAGVLVKELSSDQQKTLSITSGQLMPGVFLIRIRTAEGQVFSKKLLIARG